MALVNDLRTYADRVTRRDRRVLDEALANYGDFSTVQHFEGVIALFVKCKRCGALVLVSDGDLLAEGETPGVVRHWETHHPVRAWVAHRHDLIMRLPKPLRVLIGLAIHYTKRKP